MNKLYNLFAYAVCIFGASILIWYALKGFIYGSTMTKGGVVTGEKAIVFSSVYALSAILMIVPFFMILKKDRAYSQKFGKTNTHKLKNRLLKLKSLLLRNNNK